MIIKSLLILLFVILIFSLIILLSSFSYDTNNADYIIVLGHALKNNQMNNVLIYRLKSAINYLNKNKNTKVVLSGGITKNNTLSEAIVMKEFLIKNNIDESKIILEDKSIDTVENIKNSMNYIDTESKIVVISSNYHIFRSKMICKLLGLKNVKGIGVKTPLIDLIKHLLIEELFIFVHYFRIKNKIN